MLNISIDVADQLPSGVPEDLSYNEQESIIEYVLEEMIGIEDAIPESEDNDPSQNSTFKKAAGIDQYMPVTGSFKHTTDIKLPADQYFSRPVIFVAADYTDIVSPPPEV